MLECFTLLGALAAITRRIELGTMVANVFNREPGPLVAAAASTARISGRQIHLGLGAGTSPTSQWAFEQRVSGGRLVESLHERHRRVEDVLDLTDRMWAADRDAMYATFPLPSPAPTRILGVNSTRLSEIAGRRADGVNVAWHSARRDACLAAASAEAERLGRPLLRTVWTYFDEALFDPAHPERIAMREADIDRLILAELGRPPDLRRLTTR
jgi:alkanesulfonate monooxygenase SsuD/methylene tetrahydromethanopterin reductase-like flavin-dependent oxidoreductase (luciferase family)